MIFTCIEGREHANRKALDWTEQYDWADGDEFCRFLKHGTFPYPPSALRHEVVFENGEVVFTRVWKGVPSVMKFFQA